MLFLISSFASRDCSYIMISCISWYHDIWTIRISCHPKLGDHLLPALAEPSHLSSSLMNIDRFTRFCAYFLCPKMCSRYVLLFLHVCSNSIGSCCIFQCNCRLHLSHKSHKLPIFPQPSFNGVMQPNPSFKRRLHESALENIRGNVASQCCQCCLSVKIFPNIQRRIRKYFLIYKGGYEKYFRIYKPGDGRCIGSNIGEWSYRIGRPGGFALLIV